MPRKRPSAGSKKAAAARAVERAKAKFWVPPSLAQDGGTSPRSSSAKKAAKPKPKFWKPEQFGLVEEEVNGARLKYYGGVKPYGLRVEGLSGHRKRISVYVNIGRAPYNGDALLNELDPIANTPVSGWCHSCGSSVCGGVRWAAARLLKRNPLPF